MNRRTLLKTAAGVVPALAVSRSLAANRLLDMFKSGETMAPGPFRPEWESLESYQVPDWFRDAKFGVWSHWGPQCQPEHGDWYARRMYIEGDGTYKYHVEKYGHPSKFGFKDVINEWKAENWDPGNLLDLYKSAGAKYFFALANHHDNFDLFPNKYQPWNSTKFGPKKNLIGGWAKAAKERGLRFGVSVHAAHAWTFYESAQRADKTGQYAGIPYDGNITETAGKGTWWDGTDPQALYTQMHGLSTQDNSTFSISKYWNWEKGVNVPDKAYCEKFYNRTITLIDEYEPDLIYFDDTALPLWPISDAGLRIAAHFYNKSLAKHNKLEAVIFGKILSEQQRKCMVWDIERGQSNTIEPLPWQTDTCLGDWHYDKRIYDNNRYKSAKTVIHTLADVVSKNGNLLLNVPVKGDGTIDDKERKVVEEIAAWMAINGESIFGTRPWKVFGEGPASDVVVPLNAQGFNEGKGKPFSGQDIRFTTKGDALYAIALGAPIDGKVVIKSLAENNPSFGKKIGHVLLVGSNQQLDFERTADGLAVKLPENLPGGFAYSIKVLPG